MKRSINRLKRYTDDGMQIVRTNARYVFVVGIFAVFGYYNLVITPVAKITENKSLSALVDVAKKVHVDIEASSSEKVYSNILQSKAGDWYRVGVMGQSLDTDEVLRVFAVTSIGKEKEIGTLKLVYDALHTDGQYAEFVFEADDNYSDIVVRRTYDDDLHSQWLGGRIALPVMNIARLDIASSKEALQLQPTLFGRTQLEGSVVSAKGVITDSTLPDKTHFIFGQVFDGMGGRLSDIALNMAYDDNAKGDGKYRLELHEYDPSTKTVHEAILMKDSFSLVGLKKRLDLDTLHHFTFPINLDADKTYFLGISDNQVKKKGVISVKKLPQNDGYIKLSLPSFTKVGDDSYLLTNAKFEDLGRSFRYTYQSNYKSSDQVDVFEMSGDVSFNKDVLRVLGDSGKDTSFTYKIDTIKPFTALRIQATEVGVLPDQVRLEYSYDNTMWQDISYQQVEGAPQAFDFRIDENTDDVSKVFIRVSARDGDANKDVFGLDAFRVTADSAKDNR